MRNDCQRATSSIGGLDVAINRLTEQADAARSAAAALPGLRAEAETTRRRRSSCAATRYGRRAGRRRAARHLDADADPRGRPGSVQRPPRGLPGRHRCGARRTTRPRRVVPGVRFARPPRPASTQPDAVSKLQVDASRGRRRAAREQERSAGAALRAAAGVAPIAPDRCGWRRRGSRAGRTSGPSRERALSDATSRQRPRTLLAVRIERDTTAERRRRRPTSPISQVARPRRQRGRPSCGGVRSRAAHRSGRELGDTLLSGRCHPQRRAGRRPAVLAAGLPRTPGPGTAPVRRRSSPTQPGGRRLAVRRRPSRSRRRCSAVPSGAEAEAAIEQHRDELDRVVTSLDPDELAGLPRSGRTPTPTLARLTVATELATATSKHQALLDAADEAVADWAERAPADSAIRA